MDLPKLHRDWYAWTLQSGPQPEFLKKRVAYYVMAADRWRYADKLEDATAQHTPCYLTSNGSANDLFSSGSSSARNPTTACHSATGRQIDSPTTRASCTAPKPAEAHADPSAITDQTLVFALSGRLLVYHSAPFAQDTERSPDFSN